MNPESKKWSMIFLVGLLLGACTPDLPNDVLTEYKNLPTDLDYNIHVKPILADKCFACHGPDKAKQKAGLRLDMAAFAYDDLPESPGKVAIDPGSLRGSEMFHRIMSPDPEYRMPNIKSNLTLSSKEKAILIKWIEQGATYKPHWAFVKPEKSEVPEIEKTWPINAIDNFIFQRLAQEKMQPSPQAPKELLLRRVSLDLIGLPPTLEEIDLFLEDSSSNAYEKVVDRLLASPHFGEKMAVDWLDLARFADSHGYTVDRVRDMSPYRDWVIKAFNENFPYDKFLHWQLAGDLMPNPTKEMLMATAFNRIHQQNTEGGIIEEEFRVEYVVDRVNTTGVAIMGLPVGCARCHDHKFDPISQKNYYEMFSFFNNVKEAGQIAYSDAMPSPTMLLPTEEKEKIMGFLRSKIAQQEKELGQVEQDAEDDFKKYLLKKNYQQLVNKKLPTNGLHAHYNFDNGSLQNIAKPRQAGMMKRGLGAVPGDEPEFADRADGKALALNGDEWLDLGKEGVFRKSDPFSIGIRVFVPKGLKEGVIFHKCVAERLFNYRGYHLYIKDNKFELSLAHTAPSDAITKVSQSTVPREQWVHLTVTYNGSGKASGLKLFQDGNEMAMETTMDQLSKDVLLDSKDQPGLQIGAWDRGYGLKDGMVDDILVYDRALTEFEIKIVAGVASWSSIAAREPEQLSISEKNILRSYYVSCEHPSVLGARRALQRARTELADSTEQVQEYMVMQEMPEPRQAYLLKRGNYDELGEEVFPNTPEAIFPFPKELPRNRYGLARWLTDPNHPLTARVAVNRYWQIFFGTGLVKTSEDFGNQGEMPSHPELLDWLATTFMESGWDVKKLCKLITMSATYRQDSKASPAMQELDPDNRLLSRGPSSRLTAEMIRDNALMASGLLNRKIGGKSIKPYQPNGLWEINSGNYETDKGDAVYRRGLYVLIKRSVPHPTLATFDATSRSYCVSRRQKTNTPLQALTMLNDPTFIEAAKVMGEQISRSRDQKKGILEAYRKLTGRAPTQHEVELLISLQQNELKKFRYGPRKSVGLLKAGQYKVDKNIEPALVAANAVVASVILNSDATLTKR
jgi:Protein of unknown function (DUF1553)/Protein of unknown function (DUF1549)/Concanavalin A-like lectin/glucanases superfamily/Planctomycete cytochrome C